LLASLALERCGTWALEGATLLAGSGDHNDPLEPLLTEEDVSRLTGRSRSALQRDRRLGSGPFFVKLNGQIRYEPTKVRDWLDARLHRSTADYEPPEVA
jgi:hypothetical protein